MSGCCEKLAKAVTLITEELEQINQQIGANVQNGYEVIVVQDGQTAIQLSETPDISKMIPILDINGSIPIYSVDYTISGSVLNWLGFYQLENSDTISITYKFI